MKLTQTFFLLAALLASATAIAADDVASQVHMVADAKAQTAFIADFSQAAAAGDAAKLLTLTWPAARKVSGDAGISNYYKNTIVPYFFGTDKVDNSQGISRIIMDDTAKSPAIVHFGYVRDAAGKRKPFEMVVVSDGQSVFMANIIVGRCRPNHPAVCEAVTQSSSLSAISIEAITKNIVKGCVSAGIGKGDSPESVHATCDCLGQVLVHNLTKEELLQLDTMSGDLGKTPQMQRIAPKLQECAAKRDSLAK